MENRKSLMRNQERKTDECPTLRITSFKSLTVWLLVDSRCRLARLPPYLGTGNKRRRWMSVDATVTSHRQYRWHASASPLLTSRFPKAMEAPYSTLSTTTTTLLLPLPLLLPLLLLLLSGREPRHQRLRPSRPQRGSLPTTMTMKSTTPSCLRGSAAKDCSSSEGAARCGKRL